MEDQEVRDDVTRRLTLARKQLRWWFIWLRAVLILRGYRLVACYPKKPGHIDYWGARDLLYSHQYIYQGPEPDDEPESRTYFIGYHWQILAGRYGPFRIYRHHIFMFVNSRGEVRLDAKGGPEVPATRRGVSDLKRFMVEKGNL